MTIVLQDWADIMAELRGPTLAIYDELLRRGVLDYGRLAETLGDGPDAAARLTSAIGWLARYRFIRATGPCWAAVTVEMARETYQREGPKIDQQPIAAAAAPTAPAPVAERTPVQRHQVQMFELEGYPA